MTIFYAILQSRGRSIVADTLGAEDPFGLEPHVIVERVIVAGYTPVIDRPRSEPWPSPGTTHEVRDADGRDYLVAIGRDAETVLVQEVREEAYGAE